MKSDLLYAQYTLVQQSRAVVFQFLEENVMDDMAKPLTIFNDKTISYMYVHIANTYIAWAGNFALNGSYPYYDQEKPLNISQIKNLFTGVDEIMGRFIAHFTADPTQPVKGYKWTEKYIETDAYSIFTHVITHEFHHKGQAMTMSRLLGHLPPDTDVMRF
ncbi:DinB family protein [Pedobacter sp. ok626]|uniref:DinB family protein n=1 Tax=Pedobacter sp. ok626 TaxID=1761882 RepID=UPI000ABF3438|nr:DinB family protein [Pedobacter sp. ok626]